MRILGKILGILVLVVVLLVVVAAAMYASDYAVEGTVTEKHCAPPQPTVTVDVGIFGSQTVEVTQDQCGILEKNNHVVYHVRSGKTTVYQIKGGQCLYDSEKGIYCGAKPSFLG